MERYNITVASENAENQSIEIVLNGELTVSHIDNIKNRILELSKNMSSVFLKIKGITMIDLSFLQMLISMKKSEGIWVKEFSAEIDTHGEFYELINNTGFKLNI